MTPSRPQANVPELLRTSRDRCVSQHGLEMRTSNPVLRLQQAEVSGRRERFLERIGGLGSELDRASLLPNKGGFCLLVSDADRIVVEAYVPDNYETDFGRFGIAIGGVWDERVAGTNGIDMALRSDRVLTVNGQDHYHNCFHAFACSSAPLNDAQNNVIGSVTLVGSAKRRSEEIAWGEQVLRVAGARFQAQLFRRFHSTRITARLTSLSPDRRARFETIVACDESGVILSSLPLWRTSGLPPEHRNLQGCHLSDLRDLAVDVQGPAMVLPRRLVSISNRAPKEAPLRAQTSPALSSLAAQGGGLDVIVERARKLAANRVPILVCGEDGIDKEGFIRALAQDVMPNVVSMTVLDGGRLDCSDDFAETLRQVQFLSEYPVERLPPILVLLNADRLRREFQYQLKAYLETVEQGLLGVNPIAARPLLVFSAGGSFAALQQAGIVESELLFLMGQSVIELPPVRERDRGKVLDGLIEREFEKGLALSEAARKSLLDHDWPGNLREMRAVLREAAICGNGSRINLVDLPPRLLAKRPDVGGEDVREVLIEALDSTGWNVTRTAAVLGKSRATINRWIAAEGLHRPE